MKWAIVIVLVVALVALLLYAARTAAETPPAPEPPMRRDDVSIAPPMAEAPTVVLERTAEEVWRADVMRTAQDYERAVSTYVDRFPTYAPGRNALYAARAIAAAAPMESRASLLFRIGFASPPPTGAGAAGRAWSALLAAVRAPINYRPELPVKPVVVTGIVPLGDFSV